MKGLSHSMTVTDSTSRAAGNVEVRKELIAAINARIAAHGWTQAEAAQRIGVSQPRISHLARGQHDRFSVDALLKLAAAAGLTVEISVNNT
jgi:predicted XRE-type DNA-binding protein